jgi:Tfp pilus assembly protein PilO
MNRIFVMMLLYGLISTLAWARALMALADERRESRQAWEQVHEIRASAAGGWPVPL